MEEPGAIVTEVARKAGVEPSLLYRWRQQLAQPLETATFVPVTVAPEERQPGVAPPPATITIVFGGQFRMTIEGAPDAATLSNAIGALTGRDRSR